MKNSKLHFKSFVGFTLVFAFTFITFSCTQNEEFVETDTTTENVDEVDALSKMASSPWDFDSSYSYRDNFQVDNDGRGAHNWDERKYDGDPNDNGFDIRDYVYVDGSRLILECPRGSSRRRAEYRDQTNIDLDRRNRMDLTFDIRDYNNRDELIMAQLHNDNSRARRPYITIVTEDGRIRLKRANSPTSSGSTTARESIQFRTNDRYRIRMDSPNNSRTVEVRIDNLDTGERARNTFSFDSDWNRVDGSFYWKHGVYMPDGGSRNTRMRVEEISFATNRT